jgi:hypothetical protein
VGESIGTNRLNDETIATIQRQWRASCVDAGTRRERATCCGGTREKRVTMEDSQGFA